MTHPEIAEPPNSLDPAWLTATVERALDEDLGGNPGRDVTTQATIPASAEVTGEVVAREPGVLAASAVITETLRHVAARYDLPEPATTLRLADGDTMTTRATIADITGNGHVVLTAERTILNLLSRASGVATHTRRWADALAGTDAKVLDTRKTNPGMRELDKYAVRCGGGVNKRFGLYDVAMVKDNHVVAAGGVGKAIAAIQERFPDVAIQVEVERLAQAMEAIDAGARFLMLDNMNNEAMATVVAAVREREAEVGKVWLEATGGLTVFRAPSVAATGVDFMSVGALTHSSPILDIALDLH